jgi:hypothetical protein
LLHKSLFKNAGPLSKKSRNPFFSIHHFWILRAATCNDRVDVAGDLGSSNRIGFFKCLKQNSPFFTGYVQRSVGCFRLFTLEHTCTGFTGFSGIPKSLCCLGGKEKTGGEMKLFKPAFFAALGCDGKNLRREKKYPPGRKVLNALTQN